MVWLSAKAGYRSLHIIDKRLTSRQAYITLTLVPKILKINYCLKQFRWHFFFLRIFVAIKSHFLHFFRFFNFLIFLPHHVQIYRMRSVNFQWTNGRDTINSSQQRCLPSCPKHVFTWEKSLNKISDPTGLDTSLFYSTQRILHIVEQCPLLVVCLLARSIYLISAFNGDFTLAIGNNRVFEQRGDARGEGLIITIRHKVWTWCGQHNTRPE